VFVEITRMFMVVLGTAAGFWLARDVGPGAEGLAGMLGWLCGYVSGGMLGRTVERAAGAVERRVDSVPAAQIVAGALGAIGGGFAGALAAVPLVVLAPMRLGVAVGGLMMWLFGGLGYRIVASKSVAALEMLGLSTRPLIRAEAFDARDGLLVDTSVLMDGQLLPLARAGLIGGDLMVARFVLDEVQGFADSPDEVKSRRAHRGLEALQTLRRDGPLRVYVLDDEVPEYDAVDTKLGALARRLQLRLLTNDGALARIAEVQGVPTCNLRRLAADLAPVIVPGDFVRCTLTRRGRERGQGVGQLDDGSMVVVNGGDTLVGGPEVALRVTSVVPTSVGRMVFATVEPTP
jgi:uncharacterized protein YacL